MAFNDCAAYFVYGRPLSGFLCLIFLLLAPFPINFGAGKEHFTTAH